MKILSNLDLRKNQLLQAVIEHAAEHPALPVKGQIYFNTTDEKFYGYTEKRQWVDLSNIYDDASIKKSIADIEKRIGELSTSLDGVKGRVDTAESNISKNAKSIEDINSEIEDIDTEIEEIKTDVSNNENAIEAVSDRVSDLEEAKVTSDEKIAGLETRLTAEVERAEREEARVAGLVSTEADRAKEEEGKIRSEFAAADSNLKKELTGEIEKVSSKLAADKSELQGKIDSVNSVAQQNKTDIAKTKEDLAKEIRDREAANTAQDLVIGTKADKSYVDDELKKKAEKVHKHVMADITDLGTVAGYDAGNEAGQVPVLDEHGKLAMTTIPTLAVNETQVAEGVEEALALNQKSGDIVIINIKSKQVKAITEKYAADQSNIARGYQVLEANVVNDEFAAYLAEGKTTYICVDPDAEKFEDRYRPLNSIADTMTRGEIERQLATKDSIDSVNGKIQNAKNYADDKVSAAKTELTSAISTAVGDAKTELNNTITNSVKNAKTELNNTITSTKETLERSISDLNTKVDNTKTATDAEILKIKEAATALKTKVDEHVADKVKHITAEERTSWNSRTKKVVASIGDAVEKEFAVSHNLGSEDVMVTVKDAATKEVIFTDIKVQDENTVVVSFGMVPRVDEFKVVVIG